MTWWKFHFGPGLKSFEAVALPAAELPQDYARRRFGPGEVFTFERI